jgi:ubiquinone/menaquinone biosynthesis C-methylase UbiE
MATMVYTGPTLRAEEVRRILPDATVAPPVAAGDLLRRPARSGDVVVIIDGYFHGVGAVRQLLDDFMAGRGMTAAQARAFCAAHDLDEDELCRHLRREARVAGLDDAGLEGVILAEARRRGVLQPQDRRLWSPTWLRAEERWRPDATVIAACRMLAVPPGIRVRDGFVVALKLSGNFATVRETARLALAHRAAAATSSDAEIIAWYTQRWACRADEFDLELADRGFSSRDEFLGMARLLHAYDRDHGGDTAARPDDGATATVEAMADLVTPWALRTFVSLRIADVLAPRPLPIETLAQRSGADALALHRVLRHLATHDVVVESPPGTFALTPLGATLRSDEGAGIAARVAERLDDRVVHLLPQAVRTGRPAYDIAYGESIFDTVARNPATAKSFHEAMRDRGRRLAPAIVAGYDWARAHHVIDVGGGTGEVSAALLAAHPALRATVVDRADAIERARRDDRQDSAVSARCTWVASDFFAAVPDSGDLYLLASVLHDWRDERALEILATCRRAMRDGARLLVADVLVPEGNDRHPAKQLDMEMLLLFEGRERTRDELVALLRTAGFEPTRVTPTDTSLWLIEAVPAAATTAPPTR